MKMKNFTSILLASVIVTLKIEGTENLLMEGETTSSCLFDLSSFSPIDVQVEDSSKAAASYSKILQSDPVKGFKIFIINIWQLEVTCEKEKSGFDCPTTVQHFRNKDETLNFLQLLEKSVSPYQSYIIEIRKEYEKLLEYTALEYKRKQEESIEEIKNIPNYPGINTFHFNMGCDFKDLNITVKNDGKKKYFLVHFNNLEETYLFLQELGNLNFLTSSTIQEVEEMTRSVAILINSKK